MNKNGAMTTPAGAAVQQPLRWHIAYWTSQIVSPPVVGILTVLLCAAVSRGRATWWWTSAYILFTVMIPTLYIIVQTKRGVISDFHLERREERIRPLLLTLACAIFALLLFWAWDSPQPFLLLAGVNAIQILLFFLLTLYWKVSMHTAAISIFSVLALSFLGTAALSLTIFVPLVAWSRVRLRRHTVAQTIGGVVLGVSAVLMPLMLYW
jgi:membrane-associated phospholipid phosphatase